MSPTLPPKGSAALGGMWHTPSCAYAHATLASSWARNTASTPGCRMRAATAAISGSFSSRSRASAVPRHHVHSVGNSLHPLGRKSSSGKPVSHPHPLRGVGSGIPEKFTTDAKKMPKFFGAIGARIVHAVTVRADL